MGQSCSSPKVLGGSLPGGAAAPEHPGSSHSSKTLQGRLPGVPAPRGPWTAECAEPPLPIHIRTFSIRRRKRGRAGSQSDRSPSPSGGPLAVPPETQHSPEATAPQTQTVGDSWRRWYVPGRELGRGISATVCEAEAVVKAFGGAEKLPMGFCGGSMVPGCIPEKGRRVAIKRFKKVGSRSFQTELGALTRVGVHPHIIRLLESYEDCEGEDVLILEFCDGGTVFDAYAQARKNGDLMPELLVARLVRQLLLALEHIVACGVEHQDVKPENMMLYGDSLPEHRAELKLGDFGWATAASNQRVPNSALPAEGAGSLWYAPPELNPPLEDPNGKQPSPVLGLTRPVGRSDMWSVGVVVYLLIVGQNPFNSAMKQRSPKAIEEEVIRLVADAQYDTSCTRWLELPPDARDFVEAMLQVNPHDRLSASDALRHPYLVRRLARCSEVAPPEPAWRWADREDSWLRLDGFQRLAWVAVVRAVSEPELSREVVASATRAMRTSNTSRGALESAYIWHLARELSASPVHIWLQGQGAWAEVLRLSFRYLDVDNDGVLSPKDLVSHLVSPGADAGAHSDAWSAAHLWVARWAKPHAKSQGPRSAGLAGLDPTNFRSALLASPRADSSRALGDGVDQLVEEGYEGEANFELRRSGLAGRSRDEEEFCGWGDMFKGD